MFSIDRYFISFYGRIIFCCVDIPHVFIHSSADGYLSCIHFLMITSNPARNTGVQDFV